MSATRRRGLVSVKDARILTAYNCNTCTTHRQLNSKDVQVLQTAKVYYYGERRICYAKI